MHFTNERPYRTHLHVGGVDLHNLAGRADGIEVPLLLRARQREVQPERRQQGLGLVVGAQGLDDLDAPLVVLEGARTVPRGDAHVALVLVPHRLVLLLGIPGRGDGGTGGRKYLLCYL